MADHVVDELYGYTAGHLPPAEVSRVEAHLRDCAECRKEADELDRLTETFSVPSSSVLSKLQRTLSGPQRFDHFIERVAKLFDISTDEAKAVLSRIDEPGIWDTQLAPGVWVAPVNAGPGVGEGAFTVLLKLEPGAVFPEHTHGGEEQVLVLEGGYLDVSGTEYWRGELDVRQPGTSHSFTGLPGMGCLCAARTFPVTGGA